MIHAKPGEPALPEPGRLRPFADCGHEDSYDAVLAGPRGGLVFAGRASPLMVCCGCGALGVYLDDGEAWLPLPLVAAGGPRAEALAGALAAAARLCQAVAEDAADPDLPERAAELLPLLLEAAGSLPFPEREDVPTDAGAA